MAKKIAVLFTRHYYSGMYRKTTVHFFADHLKKQGFEVFFVTVGRSLLSTALDFASPPPGDISRKKFTKIDSGVQSIVMPELLHPISNGPALLQSMMAPSRISYGQRMPNVIMRTVASAEIVVIECGYGVAYYPTIKKLNPDAITLYLATDPLNKVGLRDEFRELEQKYLPSFDLVRYASPDVAAQFPSGVRSIRVPQGVDKNAFDACVSSPYLPGSTNIISIGDMSFDRDAIKTLAEGIPASTVHLFGIPPNDLFPPNVVNHGEMPFTELASYIKFADVGIMPYRSDHNLTYIPYTSLKFLQYSYCRLPIVAPTGIEWGGGRDIFTYDSSQNFGIVAAATAALEFGKSPHLQREILDWSECVDRTLREAFNLEHRGIQERASSLEAATAAKD